MKPVIIFAGAFVVAMAAATGVTFVLKKPSASAAHATSGDSASVAKGAGELPTDTAIVDSTRTAKAPGDTMPVQPASTSAGVQPGAQTAAGSTARDSTSAKAPAGGATQPVPSPTKVVAADSSKPRSTVASDTAATPETKRVGKVFSSMAPREAAKVLEHMADADVQVILGYVGPKQAALILAQLPPDRAALLSKAAIHPNSRVAAP